MFTTLIIVITIVVGALSGVKAGLWVKKNNIEWKWYWCALAGLVMGTIIWFLLFFVANIILILWTTPYHGFF